MPQNQIKRTEYYYPYHWGRRGFAKQRYEAPLRYLETYIRESRNVLDVGCGDGALTSLLKKDHNQIIGIDNQEKPLAFARLIVETPGIEFRQCPKSVFPFEDNKFDLITSFDVIEHISQAELDEFLQEIRRVLDHRGTFAISTPNRASLQNRLWGHKCSAKHFHEYTWRELSEMICKQGFTFESVVGLYLQALPIPGIEHFSQIIPLRYIFTGLLYLGQSFPSITEKFLIIFRKSG